MNIMAFHKLFLCFFTAAHFVQLLHAENESKKPLLVALEGKAVLITTFIDRDKLDEYLEQLFQNHRPQGRDRSANDDPMSCRVKKYDGTKFYGTISAVASSVEDIGFCASLCFQYKKSGHSCQSVNYNLASKQCELLEEQPNFADAEYLKKNTKSDAGFTFAIPVSCDDVTLLENPKKTAEPTAPKSRTLLNGQCGQTVVEPRLSRTALGSNRASQRIVGGTEARPHSYPWLVSLQSSDKHSCGGALLKVNSSVETDMVITASHCLPFGRRSLSVTVGAHQFSKPEQGQQTIRAENVALHPKYSYQTLINDVAVVKLSTPVRFSNNIQPICLPYQGEQVSDYLQGIVSGWGFLNEGGPRTSDTLMQLVMPLVRNEVCIKSYADKYLIDPQKMLCAGYMQGGRDACQGDSGGPLVFKQNNKFVLQGVVSFGEGCARQGRPGVYTRVSTYVDWVNEQIRTMSTVRP